NVSRVRDGDAAGIPQTSARRRPAITGRTKRPVARNGRNCPVGGDFSDSLMLAVDNEEVSGTVDSDVVRFREIGVGGAAAISNPTSGDGRDDAIGADFTNPFVVRVDDEKVS